MHPLRTHLALSILVAAGTTAAAENKRLLLVTDSGGFIHDSVGVAEQVLKEVGPKNGIDVTCYRFTRDPDQKIKVKRKENGKDVEVETTVLADYAEKFRKATGVPVEPENCGRVNHVGSVSLSRPAGTPRRSSACPRSTRMSSDADRGF